MINLQLSDTLLDSQEEPPLSTSLFEQAAQVTLDLEGPDQHIDLTIVLTNDEDIQNLNRQYLDIDAPTDVLSFPLDEVDPDSGNLYIGDVIISYPRAQAQAQAAGHSVEAELRLLTVHGVLHLLGHDHADEAEKASMWAAQEQILAQLVDQ
jgi:probable rRNA maturation factor